MERTKMWNLKQLEKENNILVDIGEINRAVVRATLQNLQILQWLNVVDVDKAYWCCSSMSTDKADKNYRRNCNQMDKWTKWTNESRIDKLICWTPNFKLIKYVGIWLTFLYCGQRTVSIKLAFISVHKNSPQNPTSYITIRGFIPFIKTKAPWIFPSLIRPFRIILWSANIPPHHMTFSPGPRDYYLFMWPIGRRGD